MKNMDKLLIIIAIIIQIYMAHTLTEIREKTRATAGYTEDTWRVLEASKIINPSL